MHFKLRERVISIQGSIVVSIPACHAGDPGSIPGLGVFIKCHFWIILWIVKYEVCSLKNLS